MSTSPKITARLRRKARIRARVIGTAVKPRLSVFRSNHRISAQLIDDSVGKTLAAANDLKMKKGVKKDRATQVGTEIAKLAQAKNITECVFDRSGYRYHGRVQSLAEAARKAGLKF